MSFCLRHVPLGGVLLLYTLTTIWSHPTVSDHNAPEVAAVPPYPAALPSETAVIAKTTQPPAVDLVSPSTNQEETDGAIGLLRNFTGGAIELLRNLEAAPMPVVPNLAQSTSSLPLESLAVPQAGHAKPRPQLKISLMGRLGNKLFQWASAHGIALKNNLDACIIDGWGGDTMQDMFQGQLSMGNCSSEIGQWQLGRWLFPPHEVSLHESSFAQFTNFNIRRDAKIEFSYLQSYKYFDKISSTLVPKLMFKQDIADAVHEFMAPLTKEKQTLVGIHLRHGDLVQLGYVTFPPSNYFEDAMQHFRSKYGNVTFLVASDSPEWVKQQRFAQAEDVVRISDYPLSSAKVDFAVLAGCDHLIMSVGTYGWWAAYLGAHQKGGEVVYYANEFNMSHPNCQGVTVADYYPPTWTPSPGTLAETL